MVDARLKIASALAVCLSAAAVVSPAWAQGPRRASLEQQKICADQAQKFFRDLVAPKPSRTPIDPLRASYVDHYDAAANICYVAIVRYDPFGGHPKGITYSTTVFDAFEGTNYAAYIQLSDNVRAGIDIKPPYCLVEPRGQSEIICKSEGEFDGLLEKHFGLVVR
ncbi:MAG: hypothetical protein ACLQMO_17395 [Acidobacteriaceae bacterium]